MTIDATFAVAGGRYLWVRFSMLRESQVDRPQMSPSNVASHAIEATVEIPSDAALI